MDSENQLDSTQIFTLLSQHENINLDEDLLYEKSMNQEEWLYYRLKIRTSL